MTDMHFIKGTTLAGTSGRSKDVFNPATGLVVGSVPLANASEVDAAVAAAKAALPGWANTPPAKRSQIMFKFRDLINQNLDKIAGLISGQHGKTLDDARGEVARGLVNYSAQDAARIIGQPTESIATILGYIDEPELVHRDNLVLV